MAVVAGAEGSVPAHGTERMGGAVKEREGRYAQRLPTPQRWCLLTLSNGPARDGVDMLGLHKSSHKDWMFVQAGTQRYGESWPRDPPAKDRGQVAHGINIPKKTLLEIAPEIAPPTM